MRANRAKVTTEDFGIRLPALLIRSTQATHPAAETAAPDHGIVYGSALGKQTVFDPQRFPLRDALRDGRVVLAVDVRGWGETRWHKNPGRPIPDMSTYTRITTGEETVITYNALRNGQTMVGQRAFDLLAAAQWLAGHLRTQGTDRPQITVWGDGQLGVAALHALAIRPEAIEHAILSGLKAARHCNGGVLVVVCRR